MIEVLRVLQALLEIQVIKDLLDHQDFKGNLEIEVSLVYLAQWAHLVHLGSLVLLDHLELLDLRDLQVVQEGKDPQVELELLDK